MRADQPGRSPNSRVTGALTGAGCSRRKSASGCACGRGQAPHSVGAWRVSGNPGSARTLRSDLIDLADLNALCGFANVAGFQRAHRQWVEEALRCDPGQRRDERWSEAIAVGSRAFVENVKRELGIRGRYCEVDEASGTCVLRELPIAYTCNFATQINNLRPKNTVL